MEARASVRAKIAGADFGRSKKEGDAGLRREGFSARRYGSSGGSICGTSGQAYELSVPSSGDFVAAFHRAHEVRYGYHDVKRAVEIVNLRVRATGVTDKPGLCARSRRATAAESGSERGGAGHGLRAWMGGVVRAALISRDELRAAIPSPVRR